MARLMDAHAKADNVLLQLCRFLTRLQIAAGTRAGPPRKRQARRPTSFSSANQTYYPFSFNVQDLPEKKHFHSLSPKKRTIEDTIKEIMKIQGVPALNPRSGVDSRLRRWLDPLDVEMNNNELERQLAIHVQGDPGMATV
ncbi:hypothetical protein DFJ73DRAFT_766708 [Zopfochytrium polystomum]|nr:hypothetical protein DFJ73DRAFT_766708 [Zopfochytrium polystomum]